MYIRSLDRFLDSNDKMPSSDDPHGFELLVRDYAAIKLGQDFHLYGRSGQAQHGIDIFSDDWTILIQCKAYSETKESYKKLQVDIEKEFTKAKAYFQREGKPFFRHFIISTTLERDAPIQDNAREVTAREIAEKITEQEPNLTITVWFRADLLEIINKYRIRNDGDTYAKEFEETLFLHKGQPGCEKVCLEKLFVFQEYRELNIGNGFSKTQDNLEKRIYRFCSDDKDKMLIIEGDAGSGKSTLVQKLCFEERKHSRQVLDTVPDGSGPLSPSPSLLSGRPLLTVRLRDLELSGNEEHQLGLSILSHLNIDKKELTKLFPRAVLLLDGFDELYMKLQTALGKALNCENMLNQFCGWLPGDCKLILTSRPKCVHVNRLLKSKAFSFSVIHLEHFSLRKREIWLNQYRALFPEDRGAVDEKVAEYILSIDNDSVSNLCDTPMTLYLLIGSKANFELTKNEWALYHYIFADAVVNTPYNPIHPMGVDIGELLYWITEEIAYHMYRAGKVPDDQSMIRTEDSQFLVTGETVKKIVSDLLKNEQFYQATVQAGLTNPSTQSFDLQRIHALCCYWRSGTVDGPVEFYHNNIRDFFLCEKIRRVFNQFYQECGTDEEKTDRMALRLVSLFKYGEINKTVCRFLRAYAWEAVSGRQDDKLEFHLLEEIEREFPLLEKEHHLLPRLYQNLLMEGELFDNLGMDDHIRAIRNVLLSTGLVYRSVYEPILEGEEKIRWWNDVEAVNRSGMMRFIVKNCIGKFASRSDLNLADLSWADLREADLRGADLRGADLRGADLRGADLRLADLSKARLPDGIQSEYQYEQIAHLKWLNISGLIF